MNNKIFINCIPKSFHHEEKILKSNKINTWDSLLSVDDKKIHKLINGSLGSVRNLKKLRAIAYFISTLNIDFSEAALLMNSGLISNKAISKLSPQELLQKTGRFERFLNTGRTPIIDLKKAHLLIEKAKKAIL